MRVLRSWLGLLGTLALTGLPAPAAAQPVGSEFQVNTYTTLVQETTGGHQVAADANGNFVVVWQGTGAGDDQGVFGRRYDGAGVPLGNQFRVNSYTTGGQYGPSVAREPKGNFVVVWRSGFGGIFGQRLEGSGQPLGTQFRVDSSSGSKGYPSVASDQNGNFVVVWSSNLGGPSTDVFGQRFDRGGRALGSEFQVNSYTTDDQTQPSVAVTDATGSFVVAWRSDGQDGQGTNALGVFGQRFDGAGAPQGDEFQVNTYTSGHQYAASVAAAANGGFVVVWNSTNSEQDGSSDGTFGQLFDSAGVPLGEEFQVNTYTIGMQRRPSVASDASGNFLVVWEGHGPGDNPGVSGQLYDSAGMRQGTQFQLNSYTPNFQINASVGAIGNRDFIAVWKSNNQDGSRGGVFGTRVQAGDEYDAGGGPGTDVGR